MRWPFCVTLFVSTMIAPAANGQDVPQIFEGRLSLISFVAKSAAPETGVFEQFSGASGKAPVWVGRVVKIGNQPINIFVESFYTPDELRRGPAAEWGVKLNVTFLFPDIIFGTLLGPVLGHGDEYCCE